MTTEQWVLLVISIAGNVAVAIWALVTKLAPGWQQARIAGDQDEREHRQGLESVRQKYGILENSWTADRLSTLLEMDATFIREQVWDGITDLQKRQQITESTLAQTRDTLANLFAAVEELREALEHNDRMVKEQNQDG